jgi:transposase InsO family protein
MTSSTVWQDKVTRRIIGWSLAETMTAELVISVLQKAIDKNLVKVGAIIHSDRGSQYASNGFRELLRIHGFRQSMSGKENYYDNAQAESFFSRFKAKLMEGGVLKIWNKPSQKCSATLKATTIGSGYIQVWSIKAQSNLRQN